MKKIMVHAYTQFNLGDDLFLKILFNRYPDSQFILFSPSKYKKKMNFKNVKYISSNNFFIRGFNYIMKKNNRNFIIENKVSKLCDATIFIGGSIFQQNKNWKQTIKNHSVLSNESHPYFILGANFGPFEDEDYYNEYKKIFSEYEDICFRDTYSYNLFKELDNVRIADDIVFSLKNNKNNKNNKNEKNIVISVIKPSYRPYLVEYDDLYYNKIKDISVEFIKNGYEITLMSFCKHEGDEEAIKEILKIIPKKHLKYVKQYNYRGLIEESIDIISSSSLVIGTRFHAMILGWVFNKPVVPIAYSEKMTNVMKDINFKGVYTDFKSLHKLEAKEVFNSLFINPLDVSAQIKNAEKHFEKLDEYLKYTNKNST